MQNPRNRGLYFLFDQTLSREPAQPGFLKSFRVYHLVVIDKKIENDSFKSSYLTLHILCYLMLSRLSKTFRVASDNGWMRLGSEDSARYK